MTAAKVISAIVGSLVLAGCAAPYTETPLATNFPTSKQPKLQAAAHWNVIANDVAQQISSNIKEKRPLFVNQSTVKTAFDRAFSNQLISALVAQGFPVLKSPVGALNVDIDTQAVRFSANRPQYKHTGVATAFTAGVWALHSARATPGAVLFAAVAGADAYSWFQSEFATGETPQTEIIITTSVGDAKQYLARSTSIYYVSDSDARIYEYTPPIQIQTKNMTVTGR